MKKTIVTVVIELEEMDHDTALSTVDQMFEKKLKENEVYTIVDIEDIEE